jgi:uncharacterized UPF0146 family protein
MENQKLKVIVEIEGGLVTDVTSNLKQDDIDLYVVDWDNIKAGDDVPDAPWMIEKTEADVEEILLNWRHDNNKKKTNQN